MKPSCKHKFVVGPDGRGLYARCLNCKVTIHALSLETLLEIGAARIEDGQVKFTLDKEAEKFLSPEIKIVTG